MRSRKQNAATQLLEELGQPVYAYSPDKALYLCWANRLLMSPILYSFMMEKTIK